MHISNCQYIPESIDKKKYFYNRGEFISDLEKEGNLSGYSDFLTPYPFVINRNSIDAMIRLSKTIEKAIKQVVLHFFKDNRIQKIYSFPANYENALKEVSKLPYDIGSFRPDFVYDKQGVIRICEINARFPLNGIMLSYCMNKAMDKMSFIPKSMFKVIPGIKEHIDSYLSYMDKDKPITSLLGVEKGSDIFLFKSYLEERGYSLNFADPADLKLSKGKIMGNREEKFQFIFELHRHELFNFNKDLLKGITEHIHFNDIRTQLLVHDKRILAIMYDEKIMSDYMTSKEVEILKHHIIPSYASTKKIREAALKKPQNWVLKMVSSGRGEGMLVGKECDKKNWEKALSRDNRTYVFQHFIEQKLFQITSLVNNEVATIPMNVIGLMPNFNESFQVPGIFRASQCTIINLHQGRGILMPAVLSNN